MQLTGSQIKNEGIIFGIENESVQVQQQGIDLRLRRVFKHAEQSIGVVPKEGKTKLPDSVEVECVDGVYHLTPGYYEIELEEGCNMPHNRVMRLISRSSMHRCGAMVVSAQFDAGFKTEHIGTFLNVFETIRVDKGARIAQTMVFSTESVDEQNLYKGQWQEDKQRTL